MYRNGSSGVSAYFSTILFLNVQALTQFGNVGTVQCVDGCFALTDAFEALRIPSIPLPPPLSLRLRTEEKILYWSFG